MPCVPIGILIDRLLIDCDFLIDTPLTETGLRPFGVSFLFAGYDRHHGYARPPQRPPSLSSPPAISDLSLLFIPRLDLDSFQLYESDPAGTFGGWSATAIGANFQAGKSLLKNEYAEGCDLETGLKLGAKV